VVNTARLHAMVESYMIRWHLPEILEDRGWTAYRLAQETGLTVPAAYRLAKGERVQRLDIQTLDSLCRALKVTPGDLLSYSEKKRRAG
jgi:DNA-binding Xre family transcriptional regulator